MPIALPFLLINQFSVVVAAVAVDVSVAAVVVVAVSVVGVVVCHWVVFANGVCIR